MPHRAYASVIARLLKIKPLQSLHLEARKGKNTHSGAERGGAERPAACDLIFGNKSVDLFPRIKSQAAGRSAPLRSAPLYVCLYS